MNDEQVKSLFKLAGIGVMRLWEIPNQYWPLTPEYDETRKLSPWWLVKTPRGLIEIGWRKRVISIDWQETEIKCKVTDDDVTKAETMVHAYGYAKALEYLTVLAREFCAKP